MNYYFAILVLFILEKSKKLDVYLQAQIITHKKHIKL